MNAEADNNQKLLCNISSSQNTKSQTGAGMFIGKGAITSIFTMQKVNARSLKEKILSHRLIKFSKKSTPKLIKKEKK